MKRLIKKSSIIDIDKSFSSWRDFEIELEIGDTFDPFEQYNVLIENKKYLIAIEGWYDDCLESINLGETNEQNIEMEYSHLMENQFGFFPEKQNYLKDSELSEYGVSYIAKEV